MDRRLELHQALLQFSPNVYFQPPSNIQMTYPCIVYNKTSKEVERANDHIYKSAQGYQITVIDRNPDSTTAGAILSHFPYSSPGSDFVKDNLNHSTVNLYF